MEGHEGGSAAGEGAHGTMSADEKAAEKDEQEEFSDRLRNTGMDFQTKKVIHKSVNKWAEKFEKLALNEDAIN